MKILEDLEQLILSKYDTATIDDSLSISHTMFELSWIHELLELLNG